MSRKLFDRVRRALPAKGSVGARIVRGAAVVGALGAAVKGVTLLKELAVAASYGRSDALDAFLIAVLVPTAFGSIVGGAFHQAVMPLYAREQARAGREGADAAFARCLGGGLLVACLAAAALALLGGPLVGFVAGGFDPGKLGLARSMFLALVPLAVLAATATMLAAVFHAGERYAIVALAPLATPVATLAALSLFGAAAGWPLVVGALAGAAIEAGVLVTVTARRGYRIWPRLPRLDDPIVREAARQGWPAVAGMLLHTATGVVDQIMASRLAPGSVAALGYAYRLVSVPLGLATIALGTSTFAVLATLRAATDPDTFRHGVRRLILRVGALTLLGSAVLAAGGPWLVTLIYQRGRFSSEDARLVGSLVRVFAFMVPPYVLGILGVKVLAVIGQNKRVLPIAAVNLVASVVGNLILVHFLGIHGIALASVLVYVVSCAQIGWVLRKDLRER